MGGYFKDGTRLIVYRVDLIIHCFFSPKEGARQAGRQRGEQGRSSVCCDELRLCVIINHPLLGLR